MQEEKEVREIFTLKKEANPCDMPEVYSASSKRIAVIEFRNKEFAECKYQMPNKIYDYKDWIFIGEVSERIQDIKKELNSRHTQEEIKRLEFRLDCADISRMLLFNLVRGINWFKPKKKYSLKEINKIAIELERADLREREVMYLKYLNKEWED